MRWLLLIALSTAVIASSWLLAASSDLRRSSSERWAETLLWTHVWILIPMGILGHLHALRVAPLVVFSLSISVGVSVLAMRLAPITELSARLVDDLRAPLRVLSDGWRHRVVQLVLVLPALAALAVTLLTVWYFRSWSWDAVWYHVTITDLAVQDGTLLFRTADRYVRAYPYNVELVAAWGVLLSGVDRLDDAPQIGFALLGVASIAAWARGAGVDRASALVVGATWLLIPSVILELGTSYIDVACASLLTCAVSFLAAPLSTRNVVLASVALGILVGSKFSGAQYAVYLTPWLLVRAGQALHRGPRRLPTSAALVCGFALALSLGLPRYIDNYVAHGNPVWPIKYDLPLVGELPGIESVDEWFHVPETTTDRPFGRNNRLTETLNSWWFSLDDGVLTPDVHMGGFGRLFPLLLVPALLALVVDVIRGRDRWRRLAPLVLFFVAMRSPAPYWSRYTLAAAAAGLVAYALLHAELRPRPWRWMVELAFVGLVLYGAWQVRPGRMAGPSLADIPALHAADDLEREAKASLLGPQWRPEWIRMKEALPRGSVIAHDESPLFFSEFFTHDYHTTTRFVSSEGDPRVFMSKLRALGARWVGVRRDTAASRALIDAGARLLFQIDSSPTDVFELAEGAPPGTTP